MEVDAKNSGVGRDRRACRPTDDYIYFGSGYNSGIVGNAWGIYVECSKVMVYAGLDRVPIPGIHVQRDRKRTRQSS